MILVGRRDELAAVQTAMREAQAGPASVVVSGPPGIGVTTLLAEVRRYAASTGWRVLAAAPGPGAQHRPFAGLRDLLGDELPALLPRLSRPRAHALEAALARRDPPEGGVRPLAVSLAVLDSLESLAADGPVLLLLDDLRWLDRASARTLAFALRRCDRRLPLVSVLGLTTWSDQAGVAVLDDEADSCADDGDTAGLGGGPSPDGSGELLASLPHPLSPVPLRALDPQAVARLVRDRLGVAPAADLLALVHRTSGGNPLHALAILRATGRVAPAVWSPPGGDALDELVTRRLADLPAEVRTVLLHLAIAGPLAVDRLVRLGGTEQTGTALAIAADEEVVTVDTDGTARFAHPLFAAALVGLASPADRRATHLSLAAVAAVGARPGDDVDRARHLAEATEGPDAAVAARVEAGAWTAAARGAAWTAGALGWHAGQLTAPSDPATARRRELLAADLYGRAADHRRAAATLDRLERSAGTVAERADAVIRRPEVSSGSPGQAAGDPERRRLLEDLLAELPDDEPIAVDLRLGLARAFFLGGEPRLSIRECERTARLAARHGRPDAWAAVLAWQVMVETFHGRATALETLARAEAPWPYPTGMPVRHTQQPAPARPDQRTAPARPDRQAAAVASERQSMPVWHEPGTLAARRLLWTGQADGACAQFATLVALAESMGDDESVAPLCGSWTEALVREGRLEEAAAVARRAERCRPDHLPAWRASWLSALVAVHQGDYERTRAACVTVLGAARATAGPVARIPLLATAGLAELLGRPDDPAAALAPLREARDLAQATGLREPEFWPWHGDFVEAALACGEVDEAAAVVATLGALAVELRRPSVSALTDRCEALVLAARGRLDEACALLDEVVERAAEPRLERARSRLAAGIVAGRARRRGAAREQLARAAAEFAAMGAHGWRARAAAERGRVGAARSVSSELTEGERRVAELVAEGHTNRQVAAALFISVKTVEANLSRVYRKLHVTGRAQLAGHLTGPPGGDA